MGGQEFKNHQVFLNLPPAGSHSSVMFYFFQAAEIALREGFAFKVSFELRH